MQKAFCLANVFCFIFIHDKLSLKCIRIKTKASTKLRLLHLLVDPERLTVLISPNLKS